MDREIELAKHHDNTGHSEITICTLLYTLHRPTPSKLSGQSLLYCLKMPNTHLFIEYIKG